jgi:pyridoxal phosphate enzyme (YggS family)
VGGAAERRAELATNLARVRSRIADACAAAGRDRSEVTLIAVTKTYPYTDVLHLAELGVFDIGENRDQEAAPKAAAVTAARVAGSAAVRWHFIGQLQRNKAKSVVRYADLVQTVDSGRLARALADAAARLRDRPLDVLVQVSIDGDPARGGAVDRAASKGAAGTGPEVDPDQELDRVVAAVAERDTLALRGLMAVAPLGWEPARAFDVLGEIAARFRAGHPDATVLSAGMSDDLEVAIASGATQVRVGSALLGNRPRLG